MAALILSSFSLLTACGADLGTPPVGHSDSATTAQPTDSTDTGANDSADVAETADSGVIEDVAPGELPEEMALGDDTGGKAYVAAPSTYFDLTHWYLTLPSSDQVMPAELN